jgi:hypothetical protein
VFHATHSYSGPFAGSFQLNCAWYETLTRRYFVIYAGFCRQCAALRRFCAQGGSACSTRVRQILFPATQQQLHSGGGCSQPRRLTTRGGLRVSRADSCTLSSSPNAGAFLSSCVSPWSITVAPWFFKGIMMVYQVWVGRRRGFSSAGGLAAWHAWMCSAGDRGARLVPPGRRAWVHSVLPCPLLDGGTAAPSDTATSGQQQQQAASGASPAAAAMAAICSQMVLYWRRPEGT